MRLATIDVGTNTAQLLVADCGLEDGLTPRHTAEVYVRLGEGVDASGRIRPAAQERLLRALRQLQATATEQGAEHVIVGATSASRDAANRADVAAAVRDATGLDYDVLSGEQEAVWSYVGARSAFPDLVGPALVLDIGGGSTECILGDALPTLGDAAVAEEASDTALDAPRAPSPAQAVRQRQSLDVGTVRLTERCFEAQPPSGRAIQAAQTDIDAALGRIAWPVPRETALIGTAGTVVALALANAGPEATWDQLSDADRTLPADAIRRWREWLLQATVDEVRALHPDAMAGRADVFPVGILLLDRVMQRFGFDICRVSPRDLRYGLAYRFLYRHAH
jgi:exopolyphosphatase/guanosine-5'-triphosphate,3'-diphosphate pyrophosphatase